MDQYRTQTGDHRVDILKFNKMMNVGADVGGCLHPSIYRHKLMAEDLIARSAGFRKPDSDFLIFDLGGILMVKNFPAPHRNPSAFLQRPLNGCWTDWRRADRFHGLMIMRHGKVCAEGWWGLYASGIRHGLQSHTKTYAATAVGIAYTGGTFEADRPNCGYFCR